MYFLPRRVGLPRAKELIFSGRNVEAKEALQIGLADRVVPADALMAEAQSWARQLGAGSSPAIALAKSILDRTFETPEEQIFALGRQGAGGLLHDRRTPGLGRRVPEQERSQMTTLNTLLQPRRVAIVGASADATKLAGRALVYLQKYGFRGDIYPVNPRYEMIGDCRCYGEIEALPQPPDVALVLLGTSRVEDAVRRLAAIGTGTTIVLASGFGESGADGQKRQEALVQSAGRMRLLGPNTIGLINISDGIVLSPSHALVTDSFVSGSVAVVSQSGGILGSLFSRAQAQGIGFSKLVSTGNEVRPGGVGFRRPSGGRSGNERDRALSGRAAQPAGVSGRRAARPRQRQGDRRLQGRPFGIRRALGCVPHRSPGRFGRGLRRFFQQTGVIRAERFSDLLDIPAALSQRQAAQGQPRGDHHVERRRRHASRRRRRPRRAGSPGARSGDRGKAPVACDRRCDTRPQSDRRDAGRRQVRDLHQGASMP